MDGSGSDVRHYSFLVVVGNAAFLAMSDCSNVAALCYGVSIAILCCAGCGIVHLFSYSCVIFNCWW
jgi:hypothetical protein